MAQVPYSSLDVGTTLAASDKLAWLDISDLTQSVNGSVLAITITNFFATIPAPVIVTSASANALAVGRLGSTTPAFTVDASTASQVAGFKVTGAATGGTVALVATDSGADTNVTLNAKGTGTIGIGSVSTGRVTITPVTTITGSLTLSAALVYGGVTLSNAVTGTGNMVLSASPTLTGTITAAIANFSGLVSANAGLVVAGGSGITITSAGATAGITTLAIGGAFSGATTGAFSGKVTVTSANVRLSNAFFLSGNLLAGTEVSIIGRNAADNVSIDPDGYGTVFGGAVSGITTLAGTGAVSGFTTVSVSGSIATSGGTIGLTSANASVAININSAVNYLTGTSQYGLGVTPTFSSAATTAGYGINIQGITAAAAFTMTDYKAINIDNPSKGGGSAITNYYGIYVGAPTAGGTLNYGIYVAGGPNVLTGALSGMTTVTATGKISTTVTTEQMRLNYDSLNYCSITVASDGTTTFDSVDDGSTGAFVFSDPMTLSNASTASLTLDYTGSEPLSLTLLTTTNGASGTWDAFDNTNSHYVWRFITDATVALSTFTYHVPVITTASVAGGTGFRIPHGTAPSSPVNGDLWTTTAGLYVRINGVTVGPLS